MSERGGTDPQPLGEVDTLHDYLRHVRSSLEASCADLDAEQLARRSVPPSTLSLLGLVRHLAKVERIWLARLEGRPDEPRLWAHPDDRDHDFNGAVADEAVVEEAWAAWRREAAATDAWLAADPDLGAVVTWRRDSASVRDVLVHLVEEYARHLGHADLLRECVDGRTVSS